MNEMSLKIEIYQLNSTFNEQRGYKPKCNILIHQTSMGYCVIHAPATATALEFLRAGKTIHIDMFTLIN